MLKFTRYPQWWYISKHQFAMMVSGTLLNFSFNYAIDVASQVYSKQLLIPFNEPLFYDFAISSVLYCFFRLVPIFFAVTYGPLVGMVVAGVGSMLSDLLVGYGFSWAWFTGALMLGFIAGFAFYKTQGRYTSLYAIGFVTVFASFAQALALVLPVYYSMWVWHRNFYEATQLYVVELWPTVVFIFLFLPVILVLYSRAMGRIGHTKETE